MLTSPGLLDPNLDPKAMTFTLVGFCTLSHAMYTVQLPLGAGNRTVLKGAEG